MEFQLIRQAQHGDARAYSSLITVHKAGVHRFCYGLVREPEEAQDLAQDAFITGYNKIRAYKPTGGFKAWLCKIAYHRFLNNREKERRRTEIQPFIEQEVEYLAQVNAEKDFPEQDGSALIRDAFEKIPDEYRICLELKYLQEFSIQEISETLSLPPATVKTRLFRGKALLGRAIKFAEKKQYEV